jgi:anti-anti-sigma factor
MEDVNRPAGAVGDAAAAVDASGVLVVTLSGEIDISNVDLLRASIEPALAHAPDVVVFDLAALQFMDSSGIAMLLRAAARIPTVRVRNPSPMVRRIIEVTGLTGVLHIEP